MARFIHAHFLQDRPALLIFRRQSHQMPVEVLDNLALGLSKKPQAQSISKQSCRSADGERSRVIQGIEQARTAAQLFDAACRPCEMFGFLPRSAFERVLDLRTA